MWPINIEDQPNIIYESTKVLKGRPHAMLQFFTLTYDQGPYNPTVRTLCMLVKHMLTQYPQTDIWCQQIIMKGVTST